MSVETVVWDPGVRPPDEEDRISPRDPVRCWQWGMGTSNWQIIDHNWTLVSAAQESSVWMCSRCRKIEERRAIRDEAA